MPPPQLQYLSQRRLWIFLLVLILFPAVTSHAKIFDVNVNGSASTKYNDNITFTKDNRKSDVVSDLKIGLELNQEGKTHSLDFEANIIQQIFGHYGEFNNVSENLAFKLKKELTEHDNITLKDGFSHAEEPSSFEDAFGRTSGRYSTYRNNFGVIYNRDVTEQLSVHTDYTNDLTDFSLKSSSDTTAHKVGFGADYTLDSATIFRPNYSFLRRNFDNGPSSDIHEFFTGIRRFLTSKLYLDLEPGIGWISGYDDQNYTRPRYRAALSYDLDDKTVTGISYERSYSTNAYTQDLFDNWRVAANWIAQLSSRLQATFTSFVGEGRYVNSGNKQRILGSAVGLNYELTKNSQTSVAYSFSQQDDKNGTSSYTQNLLMLALTFKF